jgi:hypothetical protein
MSRVKTTVESRRTRGLCIGNTSLGETKVWRDGLYYIERDEQEASKLDQVRGWRAQGMTYQEIVCRCQEKGIMTRRGDPPKLSTVGTWVRG